MKTTATNRKLRTLLVGIRDETLVPNPHFQRRLVWSNLHKVAFLWTVLEGLPFPEIFISAGNVDSTTGEGSELVVDGQQRVTTLFQYFTGSADLKLTKAGSVLPYADLEEQKKVAFLEYDVVVRDLGPLSESDTKNIFQRINSTRYALNAMEVNNSRFDGPLKRTAEDISQWAFFEHRPIFTALDGRRMNDVRFTLTLIITLLSGYFNRDDEHESFLTYYNDEFPEEKDVRARVSAVTNLLLRAGFSESSRIWQKADLLTAMVELDALLGQGIEVKPDVFGQIAQKLYSEVDAVADGGFAPADAQEYYRRVRSGVNDRSSRLERGDVFRGRLLGEG